MIKRNVLIMFFAILFFFFHLTSLDASLVNNDKSSTINNNSSEHQKELSFRYLFPIPGSRYNKTETNLIIKSESELQSPLLKVTGSKSGVHGGKILFKDNYTVLFFPDTPFDFNEKVTVEIQKSQQPLQKIKYSFQTERENLTNNNSVKTRIFEGINKGFGNRLKYVHPAVIKKTAVDDISLPIDYPLLSMQEHGSSQGVVSFAPFGINNGVITPNYMIILDNYGIPLFYRKTTMPVLDFKMQENGLLTYFDMGTNYYYIMDDHCKVIDSVNMKNGYPTDLHELVITDEGHYLMMSYDTQQIDMDTVVSGGKKNASVIGLVIQELDENKHVLFQWRSWDHFKITDATDNIDLTADEIDYVHGNAIELDSDGNLLISSRHLDEITKISRETGEVIWRWGGPNCKNNQFTFVNDSLGFSHQHDIRRLSNGNVTLFDNGNLHPIPFSRVVEYNIDEVIKVASLVWEYRNDPLTYSIAMGSTRRLDNGNTFSGWGWNSGPPSINEVKPDGSEVLSISLPDTLFNYRAFKFQWKTGLFSFSKDTLWFDNTLPRDSSEVFFSVTNNSTERINLNTAYLNTLDFKLEEELPVELASGETRQLKMSFHPKQGGNYSARLYLRSKQENDMIAQFVELKAFADTSSTDVNDPLLGFTYSLSQNYPNPFNPVTLIKYSVSSEDLVKLKVFDVLGREVAFLKNEIQKPGNYEVEFAAGDLSSGIYFYTLETGSFNSTKKMLLLR